MFRLTVQWTGSPSPFGHSAYFQAAVRQQSATPHIYKSTNASWRPLFPPPVMTILKTLGFTLCLHAKLLLRDTHVLCCFYLYFCFSRWDSQEPHLGKSLANLQSSYTWQNPHNSPEEDVVPDKRQEWRDYMEQTPAYAAPLRELGKGVTS